MCVMELVSKVRNTMNQEIFLMLCYLRLESSELTCGCVWLCFRWGMCDGMWVFTMVQKKLWLLNVTVSSALSLLRKYFLPSPANITVKPQVCLTLYSL